MERAIQTLIAKVKLNQNTVSPRIIYLKNNKELIIKHYDILKPSLLAELYKISVMLEHKSVSYTHLTLPTKLEV